MMPLVQEWHQESKTMINRYKCYAMYITSDDAGNLLRSLRKQAVKEREEFNDLQKKLVEIKDFETAKMMNEFCAAFHDQNVRGIRAKRVQVDEIWSFVYAKQKNVADAKTAPDGSGDAWTWTALDADTKLIVSFFVGGRDGDCAKWFMDDVAARLATRVQLTSDGHRAYLEAVEGAFGCEVDYAQLVKIYGASPESAKGRYSPAECTGIKKMPVEGKPDLKHISTSYVERSNLTMRMSMRRFTRLTNAFSKKLENHVHMIAIYTVWYNWMRIHKTLRVAPAMAAGLTDKLMGWEDLIAAMDAMDEPKKRGPYKKRGDQISN